MKHKLVMSRSSYLTSLPVMLAFLVVGFLAAVWEWNAVSSLLLFLFLFSLLTRSWGQLSVSKLELRFEADKKGVFPGENLNTRISIRNGKLLPVLWMELFLPLSKNHCLLPEETRAPEEWEKPALTQSDASDSLVGSCTVPGLLWHEEGSKTLCWTAQHRGIYTTGLWRIRAGDGFGLAQVDMGLENGEVFAVYPALVDVDPSYFLRNFWNAEVGPRGVMEDLTVIRSTRGYSASDPAKKINWRLKARGLPLQVNVYEDTLPRGVHFILDGESFSGPEPHLEALEESLSILASLAVELESYQSSCALSLPEGKRNEALTLGAENGSEALLWAMASYEPKNPVRDNTGKVVHQKSVFDEAELFSAGNAVGRNYYVAYDHQSIPSFASKLEPSNITVLFWKDDVEVPGFDTACLRSFRSGGAV